MDSLSEVLSHLKPRSYMAGGLNTGDDWAIEFSYQDLTKDIGLKCYAVLKGACWLDIEGTAEPLRLSEGEVVVLTGNRRFVLASDLKLPAASFADLTTSPLNGGMVTYGEGGKFLAIGGHFSFRHEYSAILLRLMPPTIHIKNNTDLTTIRYCLEQMSNELKKPQLGSDLIIHQLAYLMLVNAIRVHSLGKKSERIGWLYALADKRLGPVIDAIHNFPSRNWTLQELAEIAGMSRTVFSERFKKAVGQSAINYITECRMLIAAAQIEEKNSKISTIGFSLGYRSESAFSAAFKRVMGYSPSDYLKKSI